MKIFKFGGASVKDANSVKNIAKIVSEYGGNGLVIIVSAMGKMTNSFEWLINSYCYENTKSAKKGKKDSLNEIVDFHNNILWELFPNRKHKIYVEINELLFQMEDIMAKPFDARKKEYDQVYDSLVGYAELISTKIINAYLLDQAIENEWLDAREYVKTNSDFRQVKVNWEETGTKISALDKNKTYITQGFIGSNLVNEMTTLGREGSDFSAAIFGFCTNAENVTIWKDVAGVLNADPKYYPNAKKIDKMSYREAIELSYYGATVIHPKTIKPLENKQIPLLVKSFLNPKESGTIIQKSMEYDTFLPSYIFVENQILFSISPKDFSFIAEENISYIFEQLAKFKIKVNLIQNSALSFSVCFLNEKEKVSKLFQILKQNFRIKYNEDLTLLTIRHYSEETITEIINDRKVVLEQKNRTSVRLVISQK